MEARVSLCLVAAESDQRHAAELKKHLLLPYHAWLTCLHAAPRAALCSWIQDADLIGVLLSVDLVHVCGPELQAIFSAKKTGTPVIPILLRDLVSAAMPFSGQRLPREWYPPVSQWEDQDQAWANVASEILEMAKSVHKERIAGWRPPRPQPARIPDPDNELASVLPGRWVVTPGDEESLLIYVNIDPPRPVIDQAQGAAVLEQNFDASFHGRAELTWRGRWSTPTRRSLLLDGRRGHGAHCTLLSVQRFGPDRLDTTSAIGERLIWRKIGSAPE